MSELSLLASCVLPGCTTPVVEVGTPCDGCVSTGLVRHNLGGHRMTATEIEARDERTRNAYRAIALIKDSAVRARIHVIEPDEKRPLTLIPNEAYL